MVFLIIFRNNILLNFWKVKYRSDKNNILDRNSYFLHWNFVRKSCFVVFFLEWNEWKNPQFNFSCQNLSLERNFFKWDGKVTKIWHLLFHRIWKKLLLSLKLVQFLCHFIKSFVFLRLTIAGIQQSVLAACHKMCRSYLVP